MRLPVLLLSAVILAACSSYDPPPPVVDAPSTQLQAALAALTVTAENGMFIGAGDVARCSQLANAVATGDIIRAVLAGNPRAVVFTAGDNAYEDGTPLEFTNCYDRAWGSFNASTTPAPGNHDYHTTGASGHFGYFDYCRVNPAAKARTYYSFDLAHWHIVSLNSNIPMAAGSAQIAWLDGDLEETSKPCILAFWHHPRFSSGRHGSQSFDAGRRTGALWDVLLRHKADLIVNGHDHNYERFARQNRNGTATADGIRQFVVGTGGAELRAMKSPKPNSEYRNNTHYGVLLLTLRPGSYEWVFMATDGSIPDRSTGAEKCHDGF